MPLLFWVRPHENDCVEFALVTCNFPSSTWKFFAFAHKIVGLFEILDQFSVYNYEFDKQTSQKQTIKRNPKLDLFVDSSFKLTELLVFHI